MTKKIKTVIGALRYTVKTLAEKRGIILTVGGDTACTDGKRVNLPVLPEDDETARLLAEGYVDHEAAHVKWTDNKVWDDYCKVKPKLCVNILEDVRIERLQGAKYPGAMINLRRLLHEVVKQGGLAVPPPEDAVGRLMLWLIARERRLVLGQDALADRENTVEGHCRKQYGNDFCDRFVALADQAAGCQSTQDCADLADEIRELIKNPPTPPPPPPPPPPKPDPKSDPESGQDKGKDEEGDKGKEGQEGEDESKGSNADSSDDQEGEEQPEAGDSGSDPDSSPDDGEPSAPSSSDGGNSQSDDGNDADEEGEDQNGSGGATGSGEEEEKGEDSNSSSSSDSQADDGKDADPSPSGPQNAKGAGGEDADSDSTPDDGEPSDPSSSSDSSSDSSRIAKALKALANAEEPEEGEAPDLGSQLAKALNEIAQTGAKGDGDTPLVIANESPNPRADVPLLPQQEDGMREAVVKTSRMTAQLAGLLQSARRKPSYPRQVGTRIDPRSCHLIAVNTPENRVFASRREKVAVNTAVTLLIDRSRSMEWGRQHMLWPAMEATYSTSVALSRIEGVVHSIACYPGMDGEEENVTVLKKFGERPDMRQYNGMYGDGGTPIAEALMWAGMVLTHRHLEKRKIVVLFTDGEPNDDNLAAQAVGVLRKSGVEVYAVFFGKSTFREWIDEDSSRVLDDIQELPKVFITLLKQTLLRKAKAA